MTNETVQLAVHINKQRYFTDRIWADIGKIVASAEDFCFMNGSEIYKIKIMVKNYWGQKTRKAQWQFIDYSV